MNAERVLAPQILTLRTMGGAGYMSGNKVEDTDKALRAYTMMALQLALDIAVLHNLSPRLVVHWHVIYQTDEHVQELRVPLLWKCLLKSE